MVFVGAFLSLNVPFRLRSVPVIYKACCVILISSKLRRFEEEE